MIFDFAVLTDLLDHWLKKKRERRLWDEKNMMTCPYKTRNKLYLKLLKWNGICSRLCKWWNYNSCLGLFGAQFKVNLTPGLQQNASKTPGINIRKSLYVVVS